MANNTKGRRAFGSIRKLPSSRYQARYRGPDGVMYAAPVTYTSKSDAQAFLSTIHADLVRETWKAPRATGLTVDDYGTRWIDTRPRLKESTRSGYRSDWDNHVATWIGGYALEELTPDMVREWYGALGKELARKLSKKTRTSTATRQDGRSTVARCYRILHAVMATAAEDGLIPSNPCRVKGGGTYEADERPTLTVQEAEALVAEVPDRYSCLVIALAWTAIRLGEATELRRKDVDLTRGTIRIDRAVYPVDGQGYVVDTPKTRAGRRTVALPPFVTDAFRSHMNHFTALGPDALVFPTRSDRCAYGAAQTAITRALRGMGRTDVRVHDLRHTGQVLAAQSGATVADLMARLGHSSVNAAMRYSHAANDHGKEVATRMHEHRAKVLRLKRAK